MIFGKNVVEKLQTQGSMERTSCSEKKDAVNNIKFLCTKSKNYYHLYGYN